MYYLKGGVTEWRDRGIIPNEHLASGTDGGVWRSLNRLRVQKGRCRAMMKMWKLSHTDVCDCGGERETMSHLMTCVEAHMGRTGYSNPCWCQLCQTLGGIYMTEYSLDLARIFSEVHGHNVV